MMLQGRRINFGFDYRLRSLMLLAIIYASASVCYGQGGVDGNTLLSLRFENSLSGEQGETPTQSSGFSFQNGILGQGVSLSNGNQLFYQSAGNISATEGTIEFWIKPEWSGNDNQGHFLLQYGTGGGILIGKDGANNLRIILNRFGAAPGGERGVSTNISSWQASQWHHAAFTYSDSQKRLRLFLDGSLKVDATFTGSLPAISSSTFQLGGDGQGSYINSVIDELRTSDVARTEQEISNRYIAALTITSLTATPNSLQMYPTWWKAPTLQAATNLGAVNISPLSASWSSSNAAVASFDFAKGKIIANAAGTATLTATVNNVSANISVTVNAPVLQPLVEQISPHLSNPRADALWEMPVVIISYLPTKDGVNVDSQVADWTQSLTGLRQRIDQINIQHKFMLEEGSRFRAFGDPTAKPSLSYRVVYNVTVFEEMPPGIPDPTNSAAFFPDYEQILSRFNAQNYVNNLGVKEFWIWGYHHGNIVPVESNMSSPTTGDISNSYRHNDLPVFNKTYVVYNYNFTRTAAEATHNHGHQLESILGYVNQRQDGNTQLFWQKFVGRAANGTWQRGRCGDTHHPPNALDDYDYSNTTPFSSDIANWNPNGGTTQPVSLSTWRSINYPFPNGIAPPSDDAWWYIYWFQSMPGRENTIPYNSNRMTNWWQFTGDWDTAIKASVGLYESNACSFSLNSTGQSVAAAGGSGSVTVSSSAGCKWFATSNSAWLHITSGDTSNNSNTTVNFSADPNTGSSQRTGTLIIAGNVFTVTQGGAVINPTVKFSAASYSLNEGAGTATIEVTRAGDTSLAASVDYATADGTAQQRSDYTISSGTLNFAAGDTSKSLTVLISDDTYQEGSETINLTLSNPSGGLTIASPGTTTVTIIDNDSSAPTTNPIDDAQFFVRQHYYDFLNRAPDAGGLGYWSSQITQCGADINCINSRRIGVSAAYFIELEFQDTGSFVYRFYKASYGQRPTYAQFMPDRSRVVGGADLESGKQAFADAWVQRPEFVQKYPTNLSGTQFIDALLQTVQQGSGVDLSSQRTTLINDYNAHQSRSRIVRLIADDATFKAAEYNRAFVLMQYFGYLRRDPDEGGYLFWLDVLNNKVANNYRGMVCAFLTSAEYQDRFSPVVTRNDSICASAAP